MADVFLIKDRQQVSPVLLQVVPDLEEVNDSSQIFLEAFNSLLEDFG